MVVVVLSDPNEILQKHLQRVKILEVLFCDVWVFWSAGIVCNCRRSQIGLYTYVANNISIGWTRRVYQNRYGHCYRGMPSWHHLSVFVVSITVVSRGALCVYFCVVVCIGDEVCHQFNRRVLVALKNDFSCGDITVWQSTSVKIFNESLKSGQPRCAAGISVSSDTAVNGEVLSVSPMLSGGVLQLGDWYTNLISCTSFGDLSSCFLLVVHSKRSLSIADKYALSFSKSFEWSKIG